MCIQVFIHLGEKQREAESAGAPHYDQFWNTLDLQANEKFLPLGSPKYDKITNTVLDSDDLPEE